VLGNLDQIITALTPQRDAEAADAR
jgi:hypothetical protein